MKKSITTLIILLIFSLNCFSQFGADYSSYGFNFINNEYNEGLNHWTGNGINNSDKIDFYKQDNLNNYAAVLKPVNETLSISYNDFGYMDMNPCELKVTIRIKINKFSGDNDALSFNIFTGEKKVNIEFTSNGIRYINSANNYEQITTNIPTNQWKTYSIALNGCSDQATLMIENDDTNLYSLDFPNDTSSQNINITSSTDGSESFTSEIDHFFIHSQPIKWWLGHSFWFIDDTPAGYIGSTGDRQHFLSLPNGETIGINENAGGFVTFTELTPGGPNLDPNPRFGSGGTKSIRGYFHTENFNPVQAGINTASGGHLVTVNTTPEKLEIESFPLHSFFQEGYIENKELEFPTGETLVHSTEDEDVYDEFGLDMRDETRTELDFNSTLENITESNGISMVKHFAEWEYIRHPAHILQFHEVSDGRRMEVGEYVGTDQDIGDIRFKFEFRLNKDLGYEWILWRDSNQTWQTFNTTAIGDHIEHNINFDGPPEERFVVFAKSPNPNDPEALAWYYPETDTNINNTLSKSRTSKSIIDTEDRRQRAYIRADWRKSNWCRMNMYVRTEGLIAPPNKDPDSYESYQMEAIQLFGSPNEILNAVENYDIESSNETLLKTSVSPNPFSSELIVNGENLLEKKIALFSVLGQDLSKDIQVTSKTEKVLRLVMDNLKSGIYFLQIDNVTHKVYKQ